MLTQFKQVEIVLLDVFPTKVAVKVKLAKNKKNAFSQYSKTILVPSIYCLNISGFKRILFGCLFAFHIKINFIWR